MKLFPNCSEYVTRIHLTPKEKKKAMELLAKLGKNKEDLKELYDCLNDDNDNNDMLSEDIAEDYVTLKEKILADRKSKIFDAVYDKKLTPLEAIELELSLITGKTHVDMELDEIIDDYEKYKSLVNKVKIIYNLENSDKKNKWDI